MAHPAVEDLSVEDVKAGMDAGKILLVDVREPDELAGSVVFLASKASDHMTGAELVIDGGFSVR